MDRLLINAGYSFTAVGVSISFVNNSSVYGTVNLDGCWFEITVGNFTIEAPRGELNTTNGTQIKTAGNFQNYGTTNLCSTCCIESTGGNIFNGSSGNPTGIINGDGALYASSGNLNNFASVDTLLNWCVNGSSTGMPMADNCAGTISICTASPLYKSNVELSLSKNAQKSVLVSWTKSDRDVKFYHIERSTDNENWDRIYFTSSRSASIIQFTDYNPSKGDNYYRIVEEIGSEEYYFSDSKHIFIENGKVVLYPNPSTQHQSIYITSDERSSAMVSIFDITGRSIFSSELVLEKGQNELKLPIEIVPAHYVVNISSEESVTSIPFIVVP
ncbi:MAG: T9SS type A sorting domain-containing protein [Bacteroidia bacterium]